MKRSIKPADAVRQGVLQWGGAIGMLLIALSAPAMAAAGASPRQQPNAGARTAQPRTVLVMGDSLSAAYGLSSEQGWVALTADRIAKQKPGWRVVNASISGETTAGGAARAVSAMARFRPSVVVIELGANDALRGLPLPESCRNLARMIGAAHGAGARVLLAGMKMPPNYGPDYTAEFERGYRELARRYDAALLPFLLEPIAADRSNFQADNLHPVAAAQPEIRDHVWTALAPLLD